MRFLSQYDRPESVSKILLIEHFSQRGFSLCFKLYASNLSLFRHYMYVYGQQACIPYRSRLVMADPRLNFFFYFCCKFHPNELFMCLTVSQECCNHFLLGEKQTDSFTFIMTWAGCTNCIIVIPVGLQTSLNHHTFFWCPSVFTWNRLYWSLSRCCRFLLLIRLLNLFCVSEERGRNHIFNTI